MVLGWACALALNLGQNFLLALAAPDAFRIHQLWGLHGLSVRLEAVVEGLVSGCWQGVTLGAGAALVACDPRGILSMKLAIKLLVGAFVVAGLANLCVVPALIRDGIVMPAVDRNQSLDDLPDAVRVAISALSTANMITAGVVLTVALIFAQFGLTRFDKRLRVANSETSPARNQGGRRSTRYAVALLGAIAF
ncbi:MAG TPA: hypothetical protein VKT78_18240, partial [Fimbriimonadaceae bacterium]|nr:hypothetical protein [Fimbriimonadaceae bacterium]